MPELPEVETIRKDLVNTVLNKRINGVIINRDSVIKEPSISEFKSLLIGAKFTNIFRRGKLLIFELKTKNSKEFFVTVHLKMSGQLVYGERNKKARVALMFSKNNFLNFNDQRALGEFRIVKGWHRLAMVKNMGPEPLDDNFTLAEFKNRLSRHTAKIKPLLLDQKFIAGIGNIYAAEALFLSGISPKKKANRLTANETAGLFRNIKKVLRNALVCRGTSFSNYRDGHGGKGKFTQRLFVYGRAGCFCYRCQSPIKKINLAGRGTYFCCRCQK